MKFTLFAILRGIVEFNMHSTKTNSNAFENTTICFLFLSFQALL